MKTTINTAYIARNSITGGYWTGEPAPNSFSGTEETAKPITGAELAILKSTYDNVLYSIVELQDA